MSNKTDSKNPAEAGMEVKNMEKSIEVLVSVSGVEEAAEKLKKLNELVKEANSLALELASNIADLKVNVQI